MNETVDGFYVIHLRVYFTWLCINLTMFRIFHAFEWDWFFIDIGPESIDWKRKINWSNPIPNFITCNIQTTLNFVCYNVEVSMTQPFKYPKCRKQLNWSLRLLHKIKENGLFNRIVNHIVNAIKEDLNLVARKSEFNKTEFHVKLWISMVLLPLQLVLKWVTIQSNVKIWRFWHGPIYQRTNFMAHYDIEWRWINENCFDFVPQTKDQTGEQCQYSSFSMKK